MIFRYVLWLFISLSIIFGWSWVGWTMLTIWFLSLIVASTQEIYHVDP